MASYADVCYCSCSLQNATSDNAVIQLSAVQAARWVADETLLYKYQFFLVFSGVNFFLHSIF